MTERPGLGLQVATTALALGVAADLLHPGGPPGLGVTLWFAVLVAVLVLLMRQNRIPLAGDGRWLVGPALVAAVGFLWRDSPILQFLDLGALAISLALITLTARSGSLQAGITDYLLGCVRAAFHAVTTPFALFIQDIRWKAADTNRRWGQVMPVVRGLVIALPLLIIFGMLFAAADALFAQAVSHIFRFNLGNLPSHLLAIIFWGWLSAGFLRTTTTVEPTGLTDVKRPESFSLGETETAIILGLLCLLFLTFVGFQFRYLFGGVATVMAQAGLTYADYARRGFFELVTASTLVLPILLVGAWLQREEPRAQRLFRVLAGSLIGLLFVIMASALQRMWLYQEAYGLTELRLYATAFMFGLAVLFVWFCLTVMAGHRNRFAPGALATGFALLLVLHVLNPDLLIARTNVARALTGHELDSEYVTSLSAAAVPQMIQLLPQLPPDKQPLVARMILDRFRVPERDWRSWNWDRMHAQQTIEVNQAMLLNLAVPKPQRQ